VGHINVASITRGLPLNVDQINLGVRHFSRFFEKWPAGLPAVWGLRSFITVGRCPLSLRPRPSVEKREKGRTRRPYLESPFIDWGSPIHTGKLLRHTLFSLSFNEIVFNFVPIQGIRSAATFKDRSPLYFSRKWGPPASRRAHPATALVGIYGKKCAVLTRLVPEHFVRMWEV